MQEKNNEVVLFGAWSSPYTARVALALKLKGIPYKYVEENLRNKSELLLQYNPIHKKVPVLLHNGKPISESLIILEYIDEVWNNTFKLLPEDPYQRAKIRFWASYFDQKIMPATYPILKSKGEDRKKAIEDMDELLRVFEEGIMQDFYEQIGSINGGTLRFLDIVVGANCCTYKSFHEACNSEVMSSEKTPEIFKWINALKEHPLMKDTLPPHDKLVAFYKVISALKP